MKERILRFGEDEGMVGIVTLPPRDVDPTVRPAFLILNAGVVHRVGPHRLGVKLARRLAAAGHVCLRFDLSGFGDSRPRRSQGGLAETATLDTCTAMDALEKAVGVRSFVLAGICLGADIGFATALADDRVRGLVLMDPYAYRTIKSELRRLSAGLKSIPSPRKPGESLRWIAAKIARYASTLGGPLFRGIGVRRTRHLRVLPPRRVFASGLRRLVDRGVEILIVHTGGRIEVYNYADQFEDTFGSWGLAERVQSEFWPDSTHTFTSQQSQERLLETVASWAGRVLGRGDAPGARTEVSTRLAGSGGDLSAAGG
jgi:pimeloyl-ACP methyl ester carboxylesterase